MIHKAFFDGSCFLHYCYIGYMIRDGISVLESGREFDKCFAARFM